MERKSSGKEEGLGDQSRLESPEKTSSPRSEKRKRQRERTKALLKEAKAAKSVKKDHLKNEVKVNKDKRIPDSEWKSISEDTNEFVSEAVDLTDAKVMQHVKRLIAEGYVCYIHFGTPCSSFSQARKDDGGPPPLRSPDHVTGLPGLSQRDQEKVSLGNSLLALSLELIYLCHHHGVAWSIENTATSFIWDMPGSKQLLKDIQVSVVTFDMCRFGSDHFKPTTIWSSFCLRALGLRCDKVRQFGPTSTCPCTARSWSMVGKCSRLG